MQSNMLSAKPEFARKLLHVFGACMFIWLALAEYNVYTWAIAIGLVIMDLVRRSSTIYGMWVRGALRQLSLDSLLRYEEKESFSGATYMAISAAICVTIFQLWAYSMGFLILAFADPAATLVGKTLGRNPIGGGKTLEGSIAFFTTAVLLMTLLSGVIGFDMMFLLLTVVAAGVATFAELYAYKMKINDNLAIPIAFGLTLELMTGIAYWVIH